MANSERSNTTNLGRVIFHSKYDKQPINSTAAESIDLKNTTNLCLAEDGYFTACSGWKNLVKIKKTVPYTFGITSEAIWEYIKERQPFEYDMALHFGLQFDLREIEKETPGLIYTEYFHTLMYLRFASYIRHVAGSRANKAIAELMKETFEIRVTVHGKNVKEAIKLVPSSLGVFDSARYAATAEAIIFNRGPFYIDQVLYDTVFGNGKPKKWNQQAYRLAVAEYGYQRPNSEANKMGD